MILKTKVNEKVMYANATITEVEVNWSSVDTQDVKAGSPVDGAGRVANNENAIGVLAETIYYGDAVAKVITAGAVDYEAAADMCGFELSAEAKTACAGIEWKSADAVIDNGGGGEDGNGVLVATVTDNMGELECDKTFAEILKAGKGNAVVDFQGYLYSQIVYTEEVVRFSLCDADANGEGKVAHFDFVQDGTIEYHEYSLCVGGGVVIVVDENQTVNGYQVPKMTAEDVTRAYNAVVAAKSCTLTDADENQHFVVNQADTVSSDICVNVLYYDKMLLTYTLSGDTVTTEYYEIGG